jgi:hypothetical protein
MHDRFTSTRIGSGKVRYSCVLRLITPMLPRASGVWVRVALACCLAFVLLGMPAPAQQQPTVSWEKAREFTRRYRTVVDTSGLTDIDSSLPQGYNAEDLQELCKARNRAIDIARSGAELGLRGLMLDDDPFSNERRASFLRRLGAVATYVGEVDDAVKHFQASRDALAKWVGEYPDLQPAFMTHEEILGIGHLRRAEVENCLLMPGGDSCLFPLRLGGVHQHGDGAQRAAERFLAYLQHDPASLEVRWLLNLSYMLTGGYPKDVPPKYLFPPEMFKSEVEVPRFFDVAVPAKLGQLDIAGGTITEDFDRDGLVDVLFTSVDYCAPARLYRNRGDGTFEERSQAAGLLSQLGGLNAIQTDYNNDGLVDVFVMRGGWEVAMRNSLLRHNADGTFSDVTREAGLSSGMHATHSVSWADIDNDGWLDLFVGHELTPSSLFRNRGDGTFEDVSVRSGIAARTAFTKGVVAGDYDNDGFADFFLSNVFGENFLYHNNGDGTFTETAQKAGVSTPLVSFPTWFFDYDNDGWLDIFVASYPASLEEFVKHYVKMEPKAETLALYRNNRDGTFSNVSREVGLARVVPAMGSNFGDLDNDGFLDMYLGTGTPSFGALMPNVMFKNERGMRFVDVTEATGTGHLQKGHGISFVDIDNDGDEDVVLNVGGAVPGDNYTESLFENPGTEVGNWISVRLVGVKTNRAAIGAKITVTLPDASSGSAQRYREVTSGGSFGSNSLTQHIGIGSAKSIAALEVLWPVSKTRQVFKNVPINSFLEVRELDDRYKTYSPPRVTLRGPSQDKVEK